MQKTHFDTAGDDHHQTIMGATQLNTVLVLMAIPGYWCAVYLIDRIGRRKLQVFPGTIACLTPLSTAHPPYPWRRWVVSWAWRCAI